MKKDKNLQFCLDTLKSLQNRNELKPEQKSTLESASKRLKKLRRMANLDQAGIYVIVRQVAEAILKTLDRQ